MSEAKPRVSPRMEELAVRVMYFMTTIDSFVPMAGITAWLAVTVASGTWAWSWWLPVSFGLTLVAFSVANYYPTLAAALPLWVATLVLSGGVSPWQAAAIPGVCLVLGALTQMVFQGTPHVVASRDRTVLWRMLASSTSGNEPCGLGGLALKNWDAGGPGRVLVRSSLVANWLAPSRQRTAILWPRYRPAPDVSSNPKSLPHFGLAVS